MNIAWIFPINRRDGISMYSHRYIESLRSLAAVECFDIEECASRRFAEHLNDRRFDCIHIQYEPSFFVRGRTDSYRSLCRRLRPPIIVSLHEIYRHFPGVFPRQCISGRGVVRLVKRCIYDVRHPVQTAYRRHCRDGFYARKIAVHYDYQRVILAQEGVLSGRIEVLPMPVPQSPAPCVRAGHIAEGHVLRLGATGFINPNYDYDLLFTALERLERAWHFSWIGGVRRVEDEQLADALGRRIAQRGWNDRFEITGWVSEEEQMKRCAALDMFLALFKHRSSSSSLMIAFAVRLPVIGLPHPLFHELNREKELVCIAEGGADAIARCIEDLAADAERRRRIAADVSAYAERHTFKHMSQRLIVLYQKVSARHLCSEQVS